MDRLLLGIASGYGEATQLLHLKVLSLAWSGADLLMIVAVLKIAALARARAGGRPIRVRWAIFALTALATPALAVTRTNLELFFLDAAIALPQYAVLIHALVVERTGVMALLKERIGSAGAAPSA